MSTDLIIANMMLTALGQQSVKTLVPADTSVACLRSLNFKEAARDMVLQEHDWLIATQPIQLNLLNVSGYQPWNYIYALPMDWLRMSNVTTMGTWQVGTHLDGQGARRPVIYAATPLTEASCIVRLGFDQLPPPYDLMVAYMWAWLAAMAVTKDKDIKADCWSTYQELSGRAKSAEGYNGDDGGFDNLSKWRLTAI